MAQELSFWEWDLFFKDIDFCVIGGGIVGLCAALELKSKAPQANILVVERGSIGAGASTRNAGFACFGSLTELLADEATTAVEEVLALVQRRWLGLQRLLELIGPKKLDFQQFGGYELFRPEDVEAYEACMERLPAYNRALAPIIGTEAVFENGDAELTRLGFQGIQHLIYNRAEGQLHPGKMIQALSAKAQKEGILLLKGLEITEIQGSGANVKLQTSQGWELDAGRVLVAVNGFARRFFPELELQPARNQVLLTTPIPNLPFKGTFHYEQGYYYFRNVGDRILLGGGRNLDPTGEQTDAFGLTTPIQEALLKMLKTVILPQQPVAIDRWWSGILGVGPIKQPIVKRVSDRVAVAVRLGGMGVAIGSRVGQEAAQMLLEE